MTATGSGPVPRISALTSGYRFPRTREELIAARQAQLETLAPPCHDCLNGHGPMQARPLDQQTDEQLFCGLWWDCRNGCTSAWCARSRDLAYQNGEPYRNGDRWEKFDGAGWVPITEAEADQFWAARRGWLDALGRHAGTGPGRSSGRPAR
jgi:hypothetical protein